MKLRTVKRELALPILFLLRIASGATANLAFFLTALYALRSRHHAIIALLLSFVFINLNPGLFPSASLANLARYLIVIVAFMSVIGRDFMFGQLALDRVSLVALIFCSYAMLHAVLFSAFPVISFLKIFIWMLAFLTLIRAWNSVSEPAHGWAEKTVYVILSAIVVFSLFSMALPQAYLPRTNLLRGILGHSQALGALAALVAVWSFMRVVSKSRPNWLDLGTFAVAALAIVSSGARTALLTVPLTLTIVGFLSLGGVGQLKFKSFKGLSSKRFGLSAVAGLVVLASQVDVIRDVLVKQTNDAIFSTEEADLTTLYVLSRGGLIGEMWENIRLDPLVGIGFGIASNPYEMVVTYSGGIPTGALVEKGVTIIAVWEETGLLGLFLFLLLLITIFMRGVHARPERVAVLIAILLVNLGEASMLSAGGFGLVQLILLGWIASGKRRTLDVRAYPRMRIGRRPAQGRAHSLAQSQASDEGSVVKVS